MSVPLRGMMVSESGADTSSRSSTTARKLAAERTMVDGDADTASSPMDMRRMITFCVASYFFLMTVFVVPLACVSTLCLLLPIRLFSMPLFLRLENRICKFVNDHWVAASVYSGMQLTEYGDDINVLAEKRCLFLANHLALIDHFVIMNSLHDKASVPGRWMWVIYNIWKYTPLGVMWTSHGNFFVNGGPTKRERLLDTFRSHLRNYFWKFNYGWVVMYPEGSRLFMIRESGAKFAEKNGLAPLRHCVYPRTGAAHAVLDVCAPREDDPSVARGDAKGKPMEYIIDATLGYPKGHVADIGSALMGEWPLSNGNISIHYNVHPVKAEYADEKVLKEFLYECYKQKDELLDNYYQTGEFPGPSRKVQVNTWTVLTSQLFWIASYYAHYVVWLRPICVCLFSSLSSLFF